MSSSGGDSGAGSLGMMLQGSPMPGLPIAGKDTAIDPYTYGKFQNFLPEPKAEGPNDMATGLRPEMFNYQKPGELRNALAAAVAGGGAAAPAADAAAPAASGGGVGTMGMGGGMYGRGSPANGVGPPPGAQQLPTPPGGWAPGNVPGWPRGGPGTPLVRPGVNSDPAAAAAALAANNASGGMPIGSVWPAGGSVATDGRNLGWSSGAGQPGASIDPETVRLATLKGMT